MQLEPKFCPRIRNGKQPKLQIDIIQRENTRNCKAGAVALMEAGPLGVRITTSSNPCRAQSFLLGKLDATF